MSEYQLNRASAGSLYRTVGNHDPSTLMAQVTQSAAGLEKRETWLSKMFPDATQRAVAAGKLAMVETEYQFRREALEIARRTQVDSLKEACNQFLVGQKAEIRQQIASFLLAKTNELQESLDRTFTDFATSMDAKMAAAELIERDVIRNTRMRQLERDLEEFALLQAELADRFRRIVSEGI